MFFPFSNSRTRGYGQLLGPSGLRSRSLANFLLEVLPPIFHVVLLVTLSYFSFHLDPDSTPRHLLAFFIIAQLLSNWFCFLRNRSIVYASPKNFPGYVHRFPSITARNNEQDDSSSSGDYKPEMWKECEFCDMHVPLRTHHCHHCRRCIFILDHHCYFLGSCVGRTNLRYFIVFCLYAAIGCGVGISNVLRVMRFYRDPWSMEILYYILPYTFVRYLVGHAELFEVIYVASINFGFGACLACSFFVAKGLWSVFSGLTPYEEKREVKLVRREDEISEEDKTFSQKFQEVFGEYGLLHFLVPWVPFEMPKAEIGYKRIITYNNDYILNGTIHSSDTNLDFTP